MNWMAGAILAQVPRVRTARPRRSARRGGVVSAVAVIVLLLVACGTGSALKASGGRSVKVTNLTGVAELRAAFDRDAGSTRLILLLSPT